MAIKLSNKTAKAVIKKPLILENKTLKEVLDLLETVLKGSFFNEGIIQTFFPSNSFNSAYTNELLGVTPEIDAAMRAFSHDVIEFIFSSNFLNSLSKDELLDFTLSKKYLELFFYYAPNLLGVDYSFKIKKRSEPLTSLAFKLDSVTTRNVFLPSEIVDEIKNVSFDKSVKTQIVAYVDSKTLCNRSLFNELPAVVLDSMYKIYKKDVTERSRKLYIALDGLDTESDYYKELWRTYISCTEEISRVHSIINTPSSLEEAISFKSRIEIANMNEVYFPTRLFYQKRANDESASLFNNKVDLNNLTFLIPMSAVNVIIDSVVIVSDLFNDTNFMSSKEDIDTLTLSIAKITKDSILKASSRNGQHVYINKLLSKKDLTRLGGGFIACPVNFSRNNSKSKDLATLTSNTRIKSELLNSFEKASNQFVDDLVKDTSYSVMKRKKGLIQIEYAANEFDLYLDKAIETMSPYTSSLIKRPSSEFRNIKEFFSPIQHSPIEILDDSKYSESILYTANPFKLIVPLLLDKNAKSGLCESAFSSSYDLANSPVIKAIDQSIVRTNNFLSSYFNVQMFGGKIPKTSVFTATQRLLHSENIQGRYDIGILKLRQTLDLAKASMNLPSAKEILQPNYIPLEYLNLLSKIVLSEEKAVELFTDYFEENDLDKLVSYFMMFVDFEVYEEVYENDAVGFLSDSDTYYNTVNDTEAETSAIAINTDKLMEIVHKQTAEFVIDLF